MPGFPIRKSSVQSWWAAPRGLSQPTTSFIGIMCQGIRCVRLINFLRYIRTNRSLFKYFVLLTSFWLKPKTFFVVLCIDNHYRYIKLISLLNFLDDLQALIVACRSFTSAKFLSYKLRGWVLNPVMPL